MSRQVRTMKDLTDSALLYQAKFPRFGYILIVVVIAALALTGFWMTVFPRVLVINGEGVVQGANKTSILAQEYGEMANLLVKEGSYVDRGDALFYLKDNSEPQRALESGIIHLNKEYQAGTQILKGEELGSINNERDSYVIVSRIGAKDRPRVQKGDEVQIVVKGLSQSTYGCLNGTVESIDSDVTIDDQTDSAFFKIRIIPDHSYLLSKAGEKVNLMNGMLAETRIKYAQMSYLDYLKGQLGISF
ncbi:HlyD family efflux transporter periplasmic adaptor subunit [Diplocloster hominis]|uniref:HlyD family efflux transporter periplasmic adaptor subunit n=1 Tax=Diplocloster hominis TaxID=3079010 RepID=UPI0031BB7911